VRKKDPSLKELLAGCVRKDFRSEELLYKTFYGYVAGVALRYIKDRDVVSELVNDVFLRVFRKIVDFTFSGPPEQLPRAFKGWIGRITANAAIDRLRLKQTSLYMASTEDENLPEIVVESPDRLAHQEIMELLDRLPPVQQLIFNLHEIEGFSHEEIAVRLNIPSATSRVYLTRARTRLIALYQKIMGDCYER
jgi:RNA polymerase sigma factor (sigma-70 family)